MSTPPSTVTIMIVSKDRRDDLRSAVASALAQDYPADVLVIDDGSQDGTAQLIAVEFPRVRLIRHAESRGLVARRNEGVAVATTDVVVSIDDDAILATPRIVGEAMAAFDCAQVGAVAIPYANVKRGAEVHQLAPDRHRRYVTDTFIGTAHAVRRDVFLALGGYRERLFHQGEEADYCIRMLAAGFVVRLGHGDHIHHFESPRRDLSRMDHYGPRNAVLFAWQNVPFPAALAQMPVTIAGVLGLTLEPSRLLTRAGGVVDGLTSCARFDRAPVPEPVFRLWRRLRRAAPPLGLEDIASELPGRG